jgi:uncharacterized membrane protein YdbT with pleckstrin-like domain
VRRKRPGTGEVHRITTAADPLADDIARRTRRYLVQMGIRVVCFALAVLLWDRLPVWVSVVLLVAAVVLPYIAVILANAGRERRDDAVEIVDTRIIGPGAGTGQVDGGTR